MQNKHSHPKVVFITGAARRIGAEIAKVLHAHQFNVILHCHTSQAEAQALAAHLNEIRAHSAVVFSHDLNDIKVFPDLITTAVHTWGRLDVLINNASRFYKTHAENATEQAWDDLLTCNAKAPFFLSKAAAPFIAKQQGAIINITDIHADMPFRDYDIYSISKAALKMVTKALAYDLAPDVRVNAVAPGPIMWPEGENTLSEALKARIIQQTALKQEGSVADIAAAVLFLVNHAEYMTGQTIAVDGGRS